MTLEAGEQTEVVILATGSVNEYEIRIGSSSQRYPADNVERRCAYGISKSDSAGISSGSVSVPGGRRFFILSTPVLNFSREFRCITAGIWQTGNCWDIV